MPDYKKKKIKRGIKFKKQRINNNKSEKKSSLGVVPENEIKVVRGNKLKRKQRSKFFITVTVFIVFIATLLSFVLPVSLYENIVNFISVTGPGSYPVSISGGNILNVISNDSYYYVLTDTNLTAYSNSGKIIFDEFHGFSNPIITCSETRALVYNQGGKNVSVYNLSGKIHSLETKNEIITASISRNGDFAIATYSDNYTSVATVFNKKFKKIFTWNSAKDIINNVAVNTKGDRLAVTTINTVSGKYVTKLSIFNFESADPLHTTDLNGSLPLSILNTGKGISVICNDKYKYIGWSKFNTNEIIVSGELNILRNSKNGPLLVFNRQNDRSDNTIVLVSKRGEKISEFKLNNTLTDIQYINGRIYTIDDSFTAIYDKTGKILRRSESNYGVKKIAVISSNTVACVNDHEIIKINIEKKEG